MDNGKVILNYILVFIALLAGMSIVGRYIKKLQPKTIKMLNRISFYLAAGSGILFYIYENQIFMYLLAAFIVSFFMFFNYKEKA